MKSVGNDLSVLNQLGKRIAYLRKKKGMSQLTLSVYSEVGKSYLSDLECGRRNPSVLVLERIACALEVSLEELFRGIADVESFFG